MASVIVAGIAVATMDQVRERQKRTDRAVRDAFFQFGARKPEEIRRECLWMMDRRVEPAFAAQVRKNFATSDKFPPA